MLLIAGSIYCYLIKYRSKQICHEWQINKCITNIKSNDELKEIDVKNRTWYYFDDIIKKEDFILDNILIDKKSYQNILL